MVPKENASKTSISISQSDSRDCDRNCLKKNNTCFVFVWLRASDRNSFAYGMRLYSTDFLGMRNLNFLFDAIHGIFSPIFIEYEQKLHVFTYERFSNVFYYRKDKVFNISNKAFGIFIKKSKKLVIGTNLVKCNFSTYMSIQYLYDDQIDCLGNEPTDEMKCQCKRTQVYSHHCKFLTDIPGKTVCSAFYMLMKENACQVLAVNEDGLVESDTFDTKLQNKSNCEIAVEASVHLQDNFRSLLFNGSRTKCFVDAYRNFDHKSNSFVCINSKKISLKLLNDLVPDCGLQA